MEKYKIVFSKKAYFDLLQCFLFIRNVSLDAANKMYEEVISSIELLSTFPNAYPIIDKLTILGSNVRKMPIQKGRYIIVYKVRKEDIVIYDILDSRKDKII